MVKRASLVFRTLLLAIATVWMPACTGSFGDFSDLEPGWADGFPEIVEAAQRDADSVGAIAQAALQSRAASAMRDVSRLNDPGPRRLLVKVRQATENLRRTYAETLAALQTNLDDARHDSGRGLSDEIVEDMHLEAFEALADVRRRALEDLDAMAQAGSDSPRMRPASTGVYLLRFSDSAAQDGDDGRFSGTAIARLTLRRDFRVTGELLVDRIASRLSDRGAASILTQLGSRRPLQAVRWYQRGQAIHLVCGPEVLVFEPDGADGRFHAGPTATPAAALFIGSSRSLSGIPEFTEPGGSYFLRRTESN